MVLREPSILLNNFTYDQNPQLLPYYMNCDYDHNLLIVICMGNLICKLDIALDIVWFQLQFNCTCYVNQTSNSLKPAMSSTICHVGKFNKLRFYHILCLGYYPLWWLREHLYFILPSSSNRKNETFDVFLRLGHDRKVYAVCICSDVVIRDELIGLPIKIRTRLDVFWCLGWAYRNTKASASN